MFARVASSVRESRVSLSKVRVEVRVEDAFERKPPTNSMMVVVACSPPACLVNGKEKVIEVRHGAPVEVTQPLVVWRQPLEAPES